MHIVLLRHPAKLCPHKLYVAAAWALGAWHMYRACVGPMLRRPQYECPLRLHEGGHTISWSPNLVAGIVLVFALIPATAMLPPPPLGSMALVPSGDVCPVGYASGNGTACVRCSGWQVASVEGSSACRPCRWVGWASGAPNLHSARCSTRSFTPQGDTVAVSFRGLWHHVGNRLYLPPSHFHCLWWCCVLLVVEQRWRGGYVRQHGMQPMWRRVLQ